MQAWTSRVRVLLTPSSATSREKLHDLRAGAWLVGFLLQKVFFLLFILSFFCAGPKTSVFAGDLSTRPH
jgi:hypothetical protein